MKNIKLTIHGKLFGEKYQECLFVLTGERKLSRYATICIVGSMFYLYIKGSADRIFLLDVAGKMDCDSWGLSNDLVDDYDRMIKKTVVKWKLKY